MEQFAPYVGMALVGLGTFGFAVCVWRIASLYLSNRGKARRTYPNTDVSEH